MLSRSALALLAVGLAGAPLCPQGQVPPATVRPLFDLPGLNGSSIPARAIQAISTIRLPGDPVGVYYVSATALGLAASAGGKGGSDGFTGRYNAATDTLTPNLDAAALNTSGTDFGLSLHHSGLFAIFDRLPGAPVLASRASLMRPFRELGRVTGLPNQSFYDPSLVNVNGALHILTTLGNDIAMAPLNPTTRAIGRTTILARPVKATWTLNSSAPITDNNGELIGLTYHEINRAFTDNDPFVALDLDPATPGLQIADTDDFTTNSDYVGGRFIQADSVRGTYTTRGIDTFWCTGGLASVGGSMEVRAHVPPRTGNRLFTSWLLLSARFVVPRALPGVSGMLGIDLATLVPVAVGPHDHRTGEAVVSIGVPNDPNLSGQLVPAQAVTLDTTATRLTLGNTCSLNIR